MARSAHGRWTDLPEDDGQAQRWQRAPFNQGFDRRARNVLSGKYRDHDMVAFDYSYKTRSPDSKGQTQTQTQTHRYRVAGLALPTSLPYLHVGPENVLTRLGGALGRRQKMPWCAASAGCSPSPRTTRR